MERLPVTPGLIVFDLDGTLIDSIGDIASAVNRFRISRAGSILSENTVKAAVGHGARELCKTLLTDLAEDGESPDDLYQAFRRIYIEEAGLPDHQIRWLPGAIEMLRHLQEQNLAAAILTNKPRRVTEVLQPQLRQAFPWQAILCPEDTGAPKPDPCGIQQLIQRNQLTPEEVLFVGDSAVDFSTGKNAGVLTLGLRGGYGQITPPEPDHWLDRISELTPLIEGSPPKG